MFGAGTLKTSFVWIIKINKYAASWKIISTRRCKLSCNCQKAVVIVHFDKNEQMNIHYIALMQYITHNFITFPGAQLQQLSEDELNNKQLHFCSIPFFRGPLL